MSDPTATTPEPPATEPPAVGSDAGATDDRPPRAPRWRRALVAILVILGCVLAPLSVLSVWLKTTLLDTDRYVSTVAPLADNEDVQNAIADRVTNTLAANVPIEQDISNNLPDRAKFVAPKIADALKGVVHDVTLTLVQSDQFSTLWEEANRRAHKRIVALLEDKGTFVGSKNGEIAIDIGAIVEQVNSRLEDRGITAFANAAERAQGKEVVLIRSTELKKIQKATDLLQKLAIVLPILTLLCFAIAIGLSTHRRRTVLRAALGFALAMALVLVVINAGRHYYLDALPSSVNVAAAGAVYEQVIGGLRLALRSAFALGLVIALAAWLVGPTRPATRIRDGVLGFVRGGSAGGEPSPVASFVARHKGALRVVVIGIGFAILVAISAPTPLTVIVIAVLVLLGILLLEFLGRGATEPADTSS